MKIGTKSILFGVHQFLFHPLAVCLAWRKLYRKWPRWQEAIAIFCHDLGYWGCPDIDGKAGKRHPYKGAQLTACLCNFLVGRGWQYGSTRAEWGYLIYEFTLYHSRSLAKAHGASVSPLMAADKYCIMYEPRWFYLLRARLSGELQEFKQHAVDSGHLQPGVTDRQWFDFYRAIVAAEPDIKKLLQPALKCEIE